MVLRSLLLAAAALAACSGPPASRPAPAGGVWVERRVGLMGTSLVIQVQARDRRAGLQASEAAVRALEAAEARLSTWRPDTELARVNAAPAGEPVVLSPTLDGELRRARTWWQETGGAFDPGVGALVAAWGLREGGRQPTAVELRAALAPRGLESLRLEGGAAVRLHPGLLLEEGGFGKGAGLDAALAALRAAGALRAVLDLGGQVAVLGDQEATFDLADPQDRERPVLRYRIPSGSCATSANSEHGIVVDGEARGHLLDPRTGRPAPDFGSLSVWAPDATASDCLSTGLYVLGPDAALAWAASRPGIEVLVLEPAGDSLRARATAGWRGRLEVLDPRVRLEFEPSESLQPEDE